MKVIIIGGGLGGLSAAIAMRRAGHAVKIFEKSSFSGEVGAAITIHANLTRILESFGLNIQDIRACKTRGFSIISAENPQEIWGLDENDREEEYGALSYTAHRVDLHGGLRELATGNQGSGIPAELHLSKTVKSYDAEGGVVYLEDGSSDRADVIIAADGVHSHAASYINESDCPARRSRYTVIRFLIPTQAILDDPITAPLLRFGDGHITFMVSKDNTRFFLRYPCRNDALQNFAMYVEKAPASEEEQGLSVKCDRNTLRDAMHGFHHSLLKLCDRTEEVLPLWRCAERDPVSRCTRGRLVMIGDAFHAMMPFQGRGFVSAAEDAAALRTLFDRFDGAGESAVIERLEMFQAIRLKRVAVTQLYSRSQVYEDSVTQQKNECLKWLSEDELPADKVQLMNWWTSYDVVKDARRALARL